MKGTLQEVLAVYASAWVRFGKYGAIVTAYAGRWLLNLAEEQSSGPMSCDLHTYGSEGEMLAALEAVGMPHDALWQGVKQEEE